MKQNNGVALTGNQQITVKQTENLIINILQTKTDVSTPPRLNLNIHEKDA